MEELRTVVLFINRVLSTLLGEDLPDPTTEIYKNNLYNW